MQTVGGRRAVCWVVMLAAALAMGAVQAGGETVVLPVVVSGIPGINGSFWDSEVRIAGLNLTPPGPIRRLWVALPGGGFVDDPAVAPAWSFPPLACPGTCFAAGLVLLTGEQLLQGTGASKGAVALDVSGTGNSVFLHNSNTLGQPRLPQDAQGPACCLPGNGQLVRGLTQPLVGWGLIPWVTAGRSPYRVSVGVINPTATARSLTVNVGPLTPFAGSRLDRPAGRHVLAGDHRRHLADSDRQPPTVGVPAGRRSRLRAAAGVPLVHGQDRVAPAEIFVVDMTNGGCRSTRTRR